MKYINELREGNRISGIYLCKHKQSAVTKNGKQYENVILQDKTGTIDAKIWDPNSMGIREFEALDYVDIMGDVSSFNGALQVSIKNARKAEEGEYNPADYLPLRHQYDVSGAALLDRNGEKSVSLRTADVLFYPGSGDRKTVPHELCSKKRASRIRRRPFRAYVKCHPFLRFYGKIVSDSEPRSADYGSNSARYRKDERTLLIPAERLHQ